MEKKFYDIIPPAEEGDFPDVVVLKKTVSGAERKKPLKAEGKKLEKKALKISPKPTLEKIPAKKQKKSKFKLALKIFFGGVVVAVLAAFGFMFFKKIEIEIKPKIDNVNLETSLTIDSSFAESDPNLWLKNSAIPGKIFSSLTSLNDNFSATGKMEKDSKAKGVITVYNGYSTSPRKLVKSRFVSADGKLFWSTQEVAVPGAKTDSKGKLIPGQIDVGIEAAQAGQDYNIGPTTFALPGLAGTASYTSVYGKSFSPTTGGFSGQILQVAKDDLINAENSLSAKAKTNDLNSLKTQVSADYILLESSVSQAISGEKSSQKEGDGADSFNLEINVSSNGIGFKKADIDKFAENFVLSKSGDGNKILDGSLKIEYSVSSVDLNAKKAVVDLTVKAQVYLDINTEILKKSLAGKNFNEAEVILNKVPGQESFDLKNFWFWRLRIPGKTDDFEVNLIF